MVVGLPTKDRGKAYYISLYPYIDRNIGLRVYPGISLGGIYEGNTKHGSL
jgi:hypothetical protein